MLRLGLESMAVRYPIALFFGYSFFVFLIWVWLRKNGDISLDLPSPGYSSKSTDGSPTGEAQPPLEGGGGEFGGGGASGSFDAPLSSSLDNAASDLVKEAAEPLVAVAHAEELAIPIYVLFFAAVVALGMFIACFYIVYIAPLLLAEVAVDGVLSYALYRKVKGLEAPHWLYSVVRRTIWPLAASALGLILAGALLSLYAPGAHTIGEVQKVWEIKRAKP
jgi:hypothetical protein